MKSHVIAFGDDGTVRTLWADGLPIASLGPLTVERASNIEFNNETSLWEVRFGDTPFAPVVFSHPSRQACIDWEIQTISEQL